MLLNYEDGEPFSSGAAPIIYQPAAPQDTTPRISISVKIQGIETYAFLDTGGVYAICSPDIATQLNLDPNKGVDVDPIYWRGDKLYGLLHRIPITILAEEGIPLPVEVTFFVPRLSHWQQWPGGIDCILGMYLCLDRLRFAIDPHDNTFYFGD